MIIQVSWKTGESEFAVYLCGPDSTISIFTIALFSFDVFAFVYNSLMCGSKVSHCVLK